MLYLHRKNRQPWFHLGFLEVSRNCLSGGDYAVSGIPEVSLSFEIPPAIPTFDPLRREILRQITTVVTFVCLNHLQTIPMALGQK